MPFARPVEEDVGELRCLGDAECRVQHHWQQRGHWKRDELGHPPAIGYEVMLDSIAAVHLPQGSGIIVINLNYPAFFKGLS